FYAAMAENGWMPYEEDMSINNVWFRPLTFGVRNAGAGGFQMQPEEFAEDGAVLTGVFGGMHTVLARLPILDQEYPTLQYMGSIEPEYMLEFAIVDDQKDLEGLSDLGQSITRMRSQLQANARRFRPIVDGWCVATDTFITRLFGTFQASFGSF